MAPRRKAASKSKSISPASDYMIGCPQPVAPGFGATGWGFPVAALFLTIPRQWPRISAGFAPMVSFIRAPEFRGSGATPRRGRPYDRQIGFARDSHHPCDCLADIRPRAPL